MLLKARVYDLGNEESKQRFIEILKDVGYNFGSCSDTDPATGEPMRIDKDESSGKIIGLDLYILDVIRNENPSSLEKLAQGFNLKED